MESFHFLPTRQVNSQAYDITANTPIGYHAFFYRTVSSLCFKKRYYTHLQVLYEKNVTEFKTLKIAFGLSFFNLCDSRLLVQTTRFVVKYLQKLLTCKAETCSTVHKVPSLYVKISRITFIQLLYIFF